MNNEKVILDAFANSNTGLTKNLKKLKKKNLSLKDIPEKEIETVLMNNSETYQRNKDVKKKTKYRSYDADYVTQLIHMDLMFLNSPKNTNQSLNIIDDDDDKSVYKYLLIAVDTYSRYLMIYLTKTKKAIEVCAGVTEIIKEFRKLYFNGSDHNKCIVLTDKGGEFSKNLIEKIPNVQHLLSKNKYGAVLAENYIYKVRDKLRYLTSLKSTSKSIKISELEEVVENINSDINFAISNKITPEDIINNVELPEKELKPDLKVPLDPEIKVGSYVRLLNYYEKYGRIFIKKSAYNNYSEKIFSVLSAEQDSKQYMWLYTLCSLDGNFILENKYYVNEILLIPVEYVTKLTNEERDHNEKFTSEEIKIYNIRYSKESDFN